MAPGFWTMPKATVGEQMGEYGFRWLSDQQQAMRAAVPGMVFAGLPVLEAGVRFTEGGTPAEAVLALYTRGDVEDTLDKDEFGKLIQLAQDKLSAKLGSQPEPLKSDNSAAVPMNGAKWVSEHGQVVLQWSFTREMKTRGIPFRTEFLRAQFLPPAEKTNLLEERLARIDDQKKTTVDRKPAKESNGDVWLNNVPMVDQGQKGYCVVAAAERVLRYYGKEVDQHELAQMAGSSAQFGTTSEEMVKALKSLTQKFMIKVRTHADIDYRGFTDMVSDYNRQAKRDKKPEIQLGNAIMVDQVYKQMDPETLKTARAKSRSDFSRWQSDIRKHVDEGVPLLWTVMVGLYKEEKLPQGFGGHMRLIIGYNEKEQTVIYSDTWGMGHERKVMPMDEGFAMSTGLFSIEPL